MKNAKYTTLLELIVALSLTATLLGFLLGYYRALQAPPPPPLWPRYALFQSLDRVISNITELRESEDDRLLFIFDNKVDREPHYSSLVLGELFHQDDALHLTLRPHPDHWELSDTTCREQLLAENVDSFQIKIHEYNKAPALIELTLNDTSHLFYLHESGIYPTFHHTRQSK
jgi:hypothetical protein